jgi:hypothetical protein
MYYDTPTNEWNREARRAAEIMADFRNSQTVDKNEDGFMVVIGYELNEVDALHIAWCPKNGVSDALLVAQFGNPHMLAIKSWTPATVADVADHLKALEKFRTRTCADNWFRKAPQVDAYLDQVRNGVYGNEPADAEITEVKSTPATTLLAPPKKKTKQKRRTNKRQPKRRRR